MKIICVKHLTPCLANTEYLCVCCCHSMTSTQAELCLCQGFEIQSLCPPQVKSEKLDGEVSVLFDVHVSMIYGRNDKDDEVKNLNELRTFKCHSLLKHTFEVYFIMGTFGVLLLSNCPK